jgi:hypothetical protein
MSIEIVAITGLVVAVIGALSACIYKIGIKNCSAFCIKSDCIPPENPETEIKKLEEKIKKTIQRIETIKRTNSSPEISHTEI